MAAVIQRPLRGSRISTFYPVKNLPSLSSLDSAFQLQEYISLLIRLDVHDVDAIVSLPGTSASDKDKEEGADGAKEDDKDADKGKNDVTVDQACWIYEQLRRLAQDLSHPLITTLQQECTRASCPEMKAGEWLYLCVAHGNDGAMELSTFRDYHFFFLDSRSITDLLEQQCCAIDYILHTVDSATALLNSPRTFPSRLQIPQTSHRHFSSLARRLGRIFAHAYFSHREAFEQAEAESSLYARFLALTSKFDLVPSEFLVIPSAQYGGEDHRDRDPPRHEYHPPQRQEEPSPPRTSLVPKHLLQQQLGVDRSRSPNPPGLTEHSSTTESIGEHPSPGSTSRSRFGRSRTDTMVFADAEASAVADELAARAKAGELEPDYEEEGPKTAKPTEAEGLKDDEEDMDLDTDTQFEISLDPEEDILGPFEVETTSVPVLGEDKVLESEPISEQAKDNTEAEEPTEAAEPPKEVVDTEPEEVKPVEEEVAPTTATEDTSEDEPELVAPEPEKEPKAEAEAKSELVTTTKVEPEAAESESPVVPTLAEKAPEAEKPLSTPVLEEAATPAPEEPTVASTEAPPPPEPVEAPKPEEPSPKISDEPALVVAESTPTEPAAEAKEKPSSEVTPTKHEDSPASVGEVPEAKEEEAKPPVSTS